ncbi:hypothetical protein AB0K02_24170 [Streptomyces sp. NPDC049597]|uniref:hypothetical protein n=1 Tax=Streptomyces sp. NPDC049597 TaxID=3155276 RepID=UPI003435D0D7
MEVGKTARKQPVEPEAVQRPLEAELREQRNLWLADGQSDDARVRGERLDRLKIARLDLAVIADGVLGAGVVPVIVTVGGVVLGDAVDVGELHVAIFQRIPQEVPRDLRQGVGTHSETDPKHAGQRAVS